MVLPSIFGEESTRYTYHISRSVLWRLLLIGVAAGIITWLLALVIDKAVLTPIFCGSTSANPTICGNSTLFGNYIAMILVGVMTVPLFIALGVRRPVLVVLATFVALLGVAIWPNGQWWWSVLLTAISYLLVYAVVLWINRIRHTILAVGVIAAFAVLARIVLSL